MTMSTSPAPAARASRTSASLTGSDARPDGNAVATDATATSLPRSAVTAVATRSGDTQTAATGGTAGSWGSGRRALAHRPRTLPGVSAPSRVVRSTMRMARSRAAILASFLMDRVARAAARSRAPTSSTPGSPCSTWRSAASDAAPPGRATAAMAPASTSSCATALCVPTSSTLPLATLPPGGRAAQAGGPGGGEPGLDDGVDQPQPLVERGERAPHGVDRPPLDVSPAVPEGLHQGVELRGQGDAAHQPVVGVDRDPEGQVAQQADGVFLDGGRGAGLPVGRRANFQRDAAVADVAGQAAEGGDAVAGYPDVVDDADAVAEALGAAPLHRLPDRRQAEALAGVNGDVKVLPGHELEGVQVAAGRAAGLGAGDVEPDRPGVPVPDGELGDLQRPGRSAHRGQQGVDGDAPAGAAAPEALQDGLHDLVEAQAAGEGQLGGEPDPRGGPP